MDRTRTDRIDGVEHRRRGLRPLLAYVGLATACSPLTVDAGRVIAIEIVGETTRSLEEGTTLQLVASALDAAGDPVPDATIVWETLDVDSGQVGFTLDPAGLVTGITPGSGRVHARVDNLRSGAITITVLPAPDSIAAVGDSRITLAVPDAVSAPLTVVVYDLPESAAPAPLAGQSVEFQLTLPSPAAPDAQGFFLTVSDSVPGTEPHQLTVPTDPSGQAAIVVRRVTDGTLPDSAVIDASATRATGSIVPGSPVRFVVLFESGAG